MPRIKDLPDQVLYRVDRGADYGPLRPLLRNAVDTALIVEQWDQLVHIAASLKDRLAAANVVMQRLTNASPADRVAKALTALGRLAKTTHILRYIHEEPLRQAIQLQLNRGEFRHILAKWLFFANQGGFRSGDYYYRVMNCWTRTVARRPAGSRGSAAGGASARPRDAGARSRSRADRAAPGAREELRGR